MATRIQVRDGDREWTADVSGATVTLGGAGAFAVHDAADGRWQVSRDGTRVGDAIAARESDVVWVAIEGELFALHVDEAGGAAGASTRGRDSLTAPMPATVVRVAVAPGARVARGDTLVVLEAMKMELAVRAPADGVVTAVHCNEGELVQPGVALVDFQ
jgi:3-methylcrotonyl-CoA carboxylase alpha subunit